MIVRGLDVSSLEAQFAPDVPGRVLVLDGDAAVYRATAKAKTLPTAYRRFLTDILTDKFLTQAESVSVHLTSHDCQKAHRALYPTWKPYQGNRSSKTKPPLLEPLREFLGTSPDDLPEEVSITLSRYWEADDAMRIQTMAMGDCAVTKSDDKDMCQFTTPYWVSDKGRLDVLDSDDTWGWVQEAFTERGTRKWVGHGHAAFWLQTLAGDAADNIRGLDKLRGRDVGIAGAIDFINKCDGEHDAANRIIWEYVRSKQNFLPEAEMLWLRRTETDSAAAYVLSLELDSNLRAWVQSSHKYHQRILAEALEEE